MKNKYSFMQEISKATKELSQACERVTSMESFDYLEDSDVSPDRHESFSEICTRLTDGSKTGSDIVYELLYVRHLSSYWARGGRTLVWNTREVNTAFRKFMQECNITVTYTHPSVNGSFSL